MNKLIKLIYINLLGLFDINKIIVARSEGVKSNLEKKMVITVLIGLFYGYVIYSLFSYIKINNSYIIFNIGFFISSLICMISNIINIEPILFKNNDNDVLFSMPVTRYQILLSKLFVIYIRNLFYVIVIMGAILLSYLSYGFNVSELFVLMYICSLLIIPFIPIVISTIIAYLNDLFKLKTNDSLLFKIIKIMIVGVVLGGIFLLFKDIFKYGGNLNKLLDIFNNKIKLLYPLIMIFDIALNRGSLFSFIILISLPIIVIYIYSLFITNNYLRMCSLLKGIKKASSFVYKKKFKLGQILGIVRKELCCIINNKVYFRSSVVTLFIFSIVLFILLNVIDLDRFKKINNFMLYFNTYLPMILAMFVTLNNSAISSFSLEKDNIQVLCSMPLNMMEIILGKWIPSILIGSIFVIINGSLVWLYLEIPKWTIIYSYVIPFIALLFVSLTSIVLDYRFIEKNETDDNVIIKGRIISFIPTFLAIIIGIGPFFLPLYGEYELLLGGYALGMLFLLIFLLLYLIVRHKKLKMNLIN